MSLEDKAPLYAVMVNRETGEIEENCSYCGLISATTETDLFDYPIPPGHRIVEVALDEFVELGESENIEDRVLYKNKIMLEKVTTKLKDRATETFTVNIEGVSYQDKRPEKAIIKK